MNWFRHMELYESTNMAKLLYIANEQWKEDVPSRTEIKKKQPALRLIDCEKK